MSPDAPLPLSVVKLSLRAENRCNNKVYTICLLVVLNTKLALGRELMSSDNDRAKNSKARLRYIASVQYADDRPSFSDQEHPFTTGFEGYGDNRDGASWAMLRFREADRGRKNGEYPPGPMTVGGVRPVWMRIGILVYIVYEGCGLYILVSWTRDATCTYL